MINGLEEEFRMLFREKLEGQYRMGLEVGGKTFLKEILNKINDFTGNDLNILIDEIVRFCKTGLGKQ